MEPLTIVTGPAAVLPIADVDTDIIIRIERLTQDDQSSIGRYAFEALRYHPDGTEVPDFPLNREGWRAAPILLAGPNFGCGSSREGAVIALAQKGVRVIIAKSFGDIFFSNCFQNGLLPVRLSDEEMTRLMNLSKPDGPAFTVDLLRQVVVDSAGGEHTFDIDPLRREGLLAGLDDVGLTLREAGAIAEWQSNDRSRRPWAWNPVRRSPAAPPKELA